MAKSGVIATALLTALAAPALSRSQEPTPPAAPSVAPAPVEHFAIMEFRVLHNTVLDARRIERAVYPYLGPDRVFADVQAARTSLEKAYRDAGYSTIYVDIPEQSVADGVVRLAVTEGKLERVTVSGTRYFLNRRILASVPSLTPGTVPHFPDVQQQLTALNQASADLRVAPILKPGDSPGTVDAELKVKDTLPLHGSVEVNDRYTANTTPTRVNLNLSYDNLFQRDQTVSLQYQLSPQNTSDARVLAATYLAPLPALHATLALLALKTDSDVATVGTLAVLGKGQVFGARYVIALPLAASWVPTLTLGADLKKFDESVLLVGGSGLQTPIEYMNWSLAYGASFAHEHTMSSVTIAANFGVRGLLNDPAQFESKRYGAIPDYIYWHADALHVHPLFLGTALAVRVSGQYTTQPLIDNEQFAIGGVDSVRGYLEAEALGDAGFAGSVEYRSPQLRRLFGIQPREAYVYGFYDIGAVRLIDPLPSQIARYDLRAWGVGLRLAGYAGVDAGFDWAHPLLSTAYESSDGSRIHFRVRYGF